MICGGFQLTKPKKNKSEKVRRRRENIAGMDKNVIHRKKRETGSKKSGFNFHGRMIQNASNLTSRCIFTGDKMNYFDDTSKKAEGFFETHPNVSLPEAIGGMVKLVLIPSHSYWFSGGFFLDEEKKMRPVNTSYFFMCPEVGFQAGPTLPEPSWNHCAFRIESEFEHLFIATHSKIWSYSLISKSWKSVDHKMKLRGKIHCIDYGHKAKTVLVMSDGHSNSYLVQFGTKGGTFPYTCAVHPGPQSPAKCFHNTTKYPTYIAGMINSGNDIRIDVAIDSEDNYDFSRGFVLLGIDKQLRWYETRYDGFNAKLGSDYMIEPAQQYPYMLNHETEYCRECEGPY